MVSTAGPAEAQIPGGPGLAAVTVHDDSGVALVEAAGIPVYAHISVDGVTVLICGSGPAEIDALGGKNLEAAMLDPEIGPGSYYIAYRMPSRDVGSWNAYGEVLLDLGSRAVLRMTPDEAGRLSAAGAEIRLITLDAKPLEPLFGAEPAPLAVIPDSTIRSMIYRVDSATVYDYTGGLSGEWEVPVGDSVCTIFSRWTYSGAHIQKATQWAGEHLEALGLSVEYHQWSDSTNPNVIAEIPGKHSPDSIFIICAHIDDVPPLPIRAPGADDNASGCIAVLVAADLFTQYSWAYTLRFALWTGEEQGLLGSADYAQRSHSLGEDIAGVLNLDMIAYNTIGSSRDIDLHAKSALPSTLVLAQIFADVVAAYDIDLIPQIIPQGTGASDHASFWTYGYTAILGIEDFGDFNPNYHTRRDRLDSLDMGYYVDFVKASVGTFAHMAGGPLPESGTHAGLEPDRAPLARLHPSYPNPAARSTVIRYDVSRACNCRVRIYDVEGRLVRTLRDGTHAPGAYQVEWQGLDDKGRGMSPGIYFSTLSTGNGPSQAHKIVLVR
jgi:hypothetical protein